MAKNELNEYVIRRKVSGLKHYVFPINNKLL